jgi:hypothetical protein
MADEILVKYDGCLYDVFLWLAGGDKDDPGYGDNFKMPDLIVFGNSVYASDKTFLLRVDFENCPIPEGFWNFNVLSYRYMVLSKFNEPISKKIAKQSKLDKKFERPLGKKTNEATFHGIRMAEIMYPYMPMIVEVFENSVFATAREGRSFYFDKGVMGIQSVLLGMVFEEVTED